MRLKRRDVLAGAGAAILLGSATGIKLLAGARPVTVEVSTGELFPALDLAGRIARTREDYAFITRPSGPTPRGHSRIAEVLLFPDRARPERWGPVTNADLESLAARLRSILARDLGYAATRLEFPGAPGLWYPYGTRPALCCRLLITET